MSDPVRSPSSFVSTFVRGAMAPALALLPMLAVIAPARPALAVPVCGSDAAITALERDGDPSRARLATTLLRRQLPALSPEERAARCRYTPSVRVVRRLEATADACGYAILEATAELGNCRPRGDEPAPASVRTDPRFFTATPDARGRLVTRPIRADDPRIAPAHYDEGTTFVARCAAYESDPALGAPALAVVRSPSTTFGACAAHGMDAERIRREVATCLESHRAGDALVTFTTGAGDEACRVVVRTERLGGAPWTRVSASGAGSGFSHAYGSAGSTRCESFGSIDETGCAQGTPLRRATAAASAGCTLAADDARALAASPAFACADDRELRNVHVAFTGNAAPAPAAFGLVPVLGVLARGTGTVDDGAVNAFVADATQRASTCTERGQPPAGRHRSDLLVTFTVGVDGVGAITTSAVSSDQGIARCLFDAMRASQASLRTTGASESTPMYQYTIAVQRP